MAPKELAASRPFGVSMDEWMRRDDVDAAACARTPGVDAPPPCLVPDGDDNSPVRRLVPTIQHPPTLDELVRDDAIVMNVRQPWAHALFAGLKNVENRTWKPPRTPQWIVVVTSRNTPTKAEMRDVERRCALSGTVWPTTGRAASAEDRGKVVGIMRVECLTPHAFDEAVRAQTMHRTPWYNGGTDHAWVVLGTRRFVQPFEWVDKPVQSFLYLKNASDAVRQRIHAQL